MGYRGLIHMVKIFNKFIFNNSNYIKHFYFSTGNKSKLFKIRCKPNLRKDSFTNGIVNLWSK